MNSQRILLLDFHYASCCSGWEDFSDRGTTSGLKTFSRCQQWCSFFPRCQGPQDLKVPLSKTAPVHTCSCQNSTFLLPYTQFVERKFSTSTALLTNEIKDTGYVYTTQWRSHQVTYFRPWSSTVWWTLAPKLIPNKFLYLCGTKLIELCCFQHSS